MSWAILSVCVFWIPNWHSTAIHGSGQMDPALQ